MVSDSLIVEFDKVLRTVLAPAAVAGRCPATGARAFSQRRSAAPRRGLDAGQLHCGEICAQALYQGQSLTSRNPEVRDFAPGSRRETEHLAWTEQRIAEWAGAVCSIFFSGMAAP